MKIKTILFFVPSVLFFASCNSNTERSDNENTTDTVSTVSEETVPALEENFPDLYNYLQSQDSSFSMQGFEGGVIRQKADSLDDKEDISGLKLYYPYFLFNADSTMALDLVTYNYVASQKDGKTILDEAGPDYEVALIDFKTGKRKQLLFFGTTGTVLAAKWKDPNTILMVGATEWQDADSLLPVIWKYELPTKSWSEFRYEKMIKGDVTGYKKPLLIP